MGLKGPPPIPSKHFVSLTSPGNLTGVLVGAASDVVTVVKYQAPWCRTCRAMAPLLDRQAKKHQELRYFSLECRRDGKAAGERMHKFFVERGAKGLPFVEVYRGDTLLEATTVAPTGVEAFSHAIGRAIEAAQRARAQLKLASGGAANRLRAEADRVRALLGVGPADSVEAVPLPPTAAPRDRQGRRRGGLGRQAVAARHKAAAPVLRQQRRGAPLRGATGPRGKRGYS